MTVQLGDLARGWRKSITRKAITTVRTPDGPVPAHMYLSDDLTPEELAEAAAEAHVIAERAGRSW